MRGVYSVDVKIAGVTSGNPRTLAYLTAPAGKVVELLNVSITNENNATNFQLAGQVARITTLGSPTGFTSQTPAPLEAGDQAAGSTVNTGSSSSTEPTTYGNVLIEEGAPSLVGFRWEPNSEAERIYVPPSGVIGIRAYNLSASSTDYAVKLVFREIG
jgi:hypothetical protein